MSSYDVVIVGGGMSGLSCAFRLDQRRSSYLMLEASDELGGKARTDRVDGFQLDRGLHVMLTAYPEGRRQLDYASLELCKFYPGAMVRLKGRFHRLADPGRLPWDAIKGAFSPIGTFWDKLRLVNLRRQVLRGHLEDLLKRPECRSVERLQEVGISPDMINRFFRPLAGAMFFDWDLALSSRMFEFTLRMLFSGDIALPAAGIGAVSDQIAAQLPKNAVRTGARAVSIDEGGVTLETGEHISARAVVVATDGPEAAKLLGVRTSPLTRSTTCLHFASDNAPFDEPVLILNGDGTGPINNMFVPSNVSSTYAPDGQALISVNVLGNPEVADDQLETDVVEHLSDWFGSKVRNLSLLRTYRFDNALSAQTPPFPEFPWIPMKVRRGLYVCGNYRNVDSMNWAMASGRRAATILTEELEE
ncbi:protoporphyrinogen/coproporphyrinogen oxidase [Thermodesulfobacteriota bacterium]